MSKFFGSVFLILAGVGSGWAIRLYLALIGPGSIWPMIILPASLEAVSTLPFVVGALLSRPANRWAWMAMVLFVIGGGMTAFITIRIVLAPLVLAGGIVCLWVASRR